MHEIIGKIAEKMKNVKRSLAKWVCSKQLDFICGIENSTPV